MVSFDDSDIWAKNTLFVNGVQYDSENEKWLAEEDEPAVTVTTGDDGSETTYASLEKAVAEISVPADGQPAPEIKVSSEATIGSGEAKVTVPANSTVTVNEAATSNSTGVTAKQITIAPTSGETTTAYVVSSGNDTNKKTAAIASTAVKLADESNITNDAAPVESLVNVAQVLANAVAANATGDNAIDVSSITGMTLRLDKTDNTASTGLTKDTVESGAPETAKNQLIDKLNDDSVKVYDVKPIATVTTTTTGEESVTYEYDASKEVTGSFTFKLNVGNSADVGKTANLTHYHENNDGTWTATPITGIVDSNGDVEITLNQFSYITVDGVEATDFASAVASASAGATITLYDDVALTSTVVIDKNLTINLNGHTITATGARALWVKSGDVTITGTGTVSASGDGLAADSSVIRVGDGSANTAAAKLTIDTGVTVSSDKSYVITVFGTNTEGIELVVNGKVVSTVAANTAADAAISGNGTSTLAATAITINGSVTSDNTYAIYHPGKGTLTVNGTVSGLGGIEAKGGTVTIYNGAKVEATAATQTHNVYGNGPSTSGYAIAAVNNTGYTANPATVNITGGTISGKAVALADQETVAIGTVTASSNDILVDNGCMWVSDGNGGYKLAAVVATIGETKYASLKDAVAAVESGETITMVADETNAVGISVAEGKNFTVDFQNHTYTVNKPGAGSAGTMTQAFQLLKGSNITFKDGTIAVAAENKDYIWDTNATTKGIARIFQNYANLTLENMVIDGRNVAHNGVAVRELLSLANGTVNITGGSITAAEGDVALQVNCFSSYTGGRVTVTDCTITGGVDIYDERDSSVVDRQLTLTLAGSTTVSGALTVTDESGATADKMTVTKADTVTLSAPEGYKWDDGTLVEKEFESTQVPVSDWETVAWVYAVNLDLLSSIQLNVEMYIPAAYNNGTVVVTFNGVQGDPISVSNLEKDGSLRVISQSVYAAQMDYTMNIALYDAEGKPVEVYVAKNTSAKDPSQFTYWKLEDGTYNTSVNKYLDALASSYYSKIATDNTGWYQKWYDFAMATKAYGAAAKTAQAAGVTKP